MKRELLFISIFSLGLISAQQKVEKKEAIKGDSAQTVSVKKYHPNFTIGIDVLHLGAIPFGNQKMIQGYISTRFRDKIHLVADIGFDKNKYQKNGYDAEADGFFIKAGALYMMASDPENHDNGFYVGGKLAASLYNQTYHSVPIRWIQGQDSYTSFPKSSQSAYWIEAAIGGRIQLQGTRIFIDAQVQPKYLMYTTKQEEIVPMIIPGFGKNANKFKLGFMWSVAYQF
ncbi:hypothetical protein FGE20_06305 [Elizabethkingia sp. JS20170427COW]|nr:hypothetical protein FGE20_06305 [Elizabethkingia sp. JS20170427COW]